MSVHEANAVRRELEAWRQGASMEAFVVAERVMLGLGTYIMNGSLPPALLRGLADDVAALAKCR